MLDLPAKKDIEKISHEILKASKALDVFPTPVDKIIKYTDLHIDTKIDLSKTDATFLEKASEKFGDIVSKIRGILDREEKIIYLDLSQSASRLNFVKLHETGHDVLPWQKATLDFLDNDETLDPNTEEEFEAEANYFASITLFQQDRFLREMKKLPLGIDSAMHLAKFFGASNHAALRRYVESSTKRCALLVLENISAQGEFAQCSVRNYFQSAQFTKTFGEVKWNSQLGYTWGFVQDYYHRRRLKKDGCITLDTDNGSADFNYHFFNSTYNAFVLFFPVGETQKSRVKFAIKDKI